jgi:hypothetical protein
MVFSTWFSSKKKPKSDKRKKNHMLIKASHLGHVLREWVVKLDLVILIDKVTYKMTNYSIGR